MLFQQYITGKKTNEIIFHVPIGSAKKTYLINFRHNSSEIKYVQYDKNTCCWYMLCMMPDNMLQKILLPLG